MLDMYDSSLNTPCMAPVGVLAVMLTAAAALVIAKPSSPSSAASDAKLTESFPPTPAVLVVPRRLPMPLSSSSRIVLTILFSYIILVVLTAHNLLTFI